MAGQSRRTFEVLRGFSYGPHGEHAYEPGDTVTDLPAEYVAWMVAEGTIREMQAPAKAQGRT